MLEASLLRLDKLSPDLRGIAEHMALATLISELVEDLIPHDEAVRIAEEHRSERTEEWLRAVNASVSSLLALRHLGYSLARTPQSPSRGEKIG